MFLEYTNLKNSCPDRIYMKSRDEYRIIRIFIIVMWTLLQIYILDLYKINLAKFFRYFYIVRSEHDGLVFIVTFSLQNSEETYMNWFCSSVHREPARNFYSRLLLKKAASVIKQTKETCNHNYLYDDDLNVGHNLERQENQVRWKQQYCKIFLKKGCN